MTQPKTRKERRKEARKDLQGKPAPIGRTLVFDWSAYEARNLRFPTQVIESAFWDANAKVIRLSDRVVMFAQASNGDLLHIVFMVLEDGMIRPFHCRSMTPTEAKGYKAK